MKRKLSIVFVLLCMITAMFSLSASAISYTADLVPQLTSNTNPSGTASASSIWNSNHEAWKVFDNTSANQSQWHTSIAGGSTGWIAYEFTSSKRIAKYTIQPNNDNHVSYAPKNWTFEAWNGSSWVVLDTRVNVTGWAWHVKKEFTFTNNTPYTKYRLNVTANGGAGYLSIAELELMEKAYTGDVIPHLTSNTAPSGIASASSIWSSAYDAWKAFDNTTSNQNHWHNSSGTTGWIAYQFSSAKTITKYTLEPNINNAVSYMPKNWTFEGWNGSSWVTLDSRTNVLGWQYNVKQSFEFNNSIAYIKYRLNVTANGGAGFLSIGEIEMMEYAP
ncbi:hypothetical protein I6N90_21085 [Paenibacillus sp. GSMTC-2017]|uniref:hypothetical protein n=1 Tax=Paenibacillus sp. GSMTC-2017 TaxID=2794350 RepID=UPI0018D94A35|nr:hypothetical protein [Paenibacillus sp. GSMTC-2017]MBH5320289.1 hypothetical protein [Paenibacillus sp. GSMTC-2017]